jgi:hypothetical protein
VRHAGAHDAGSVLFGMWVNPVDGQTRRQAVEAMEDRIGRPLDIDHYYKAWNEPLIDEYAQWSSSQGHTLFINWKAVRATRTGSGTGRGAGYVTWASIARGAEDGWIRSQARDVKAFGRTVYIAFHHEPEDDRRTGTDERAGNPRNYVEAFLHIRRVFDRQGAGNARFVWVLMASTFRAGDAEPWYPGDRSVDVVAADGYNWFGSKHPGSRTWGSFASVFHSAMSFASAKDKPFWVAETGVLEDPGDADRKAQWYEDASDTIRGWAALKAFVYFTGGRYGWWPQSSSPALKAYRQLAQAPFFRNGRD